MRHPHWDVPCWSRCGWRRSARPLRRCTLVPWNCRDSSALRTRANQIPLPAASYGARRIDCPTAAPSARAQTPLLPALVGAASAGLRASSTTIIARSSAAFGCRDCEGTGRRAVRGMVIQSRRPVCSVDGASYSPIGSIPSRYDPGAGVAMGVSAARPWSRRMPAGREGGAAAPVAARYH
jgi:hypothetical protein